MSNANESGDIETAVGAIVSFTVAASGVYVKAEQDGEELFTVNAVMTGSDVQIPDYKNNMMEE